MSYDHSIQMTPWYRNDTRVLLFHHIHQKHDPCQRIERVASETNLTWYWQRNPAKPSETQRFAHLADKSGELSSFPICGCGYSLAMGGVGEHKVRGARGTYTKV
jgi:hypothetical protein